MYIIERKGVSYFTMPILAVTPPLEGYDLCNDIHELCGLHAGCHIQC